MKIQLLVANDSGHLELTQELDEAIDTTFTQIRDSRMWVTVGDQTFIPKAKFSGTPEDNAIILRDKAAFRDLILGRVQVSDSGEEIAPILSLNGELVGGKWNANPNKAATTKTNQTMATKQVRLNKTDSMALTRLKIQKKSRSAYLSDRGFTPSQIESLMGQHNRQMQRGY